GRDEADGRGLLTPVLDVGDAAVPVHQDVVDALVLRDGVLRGRAQDLDERLLEVVTRDVWVEAPQRSTNAARDGELVPRLALGERLAPRRVPRVPDGGGRAGRDGRPVEVLPADPGEVVEREVLPLGFVAAHCSSGRRCPFSG